MINLEESWLQSRLDEAAWTQATLQVKLGGLGIQSAIQLAPSAFRASVHISRGLVPQDPSTTSPFDQSGLHGLICHFSAAGCHYDHAALLNDIFHQALTTSNILSRQAPMHRPLKL